MCGFKLRRSSFTFEHAEHTVVLSIVYQLYTICLSDLLKTHSVVAAHKFLLIDLREEELCVASRTLTELLADLDSHGQW